MAVNIIVHSGGSGGGLSSIFKFESTVGTRKIGEPSIFYSNGGYLHIVSAGSEKGYKILNHPIDLKKWYHIEIVQAKKNGKVRYYHYNLLLFKYYILVLQHRQYRWR